MPATTSPTIQRRRLPNGLEVVFEPMPWLATASFTLLVPFGASTDRPGAEGSATVLHDWLQRGAGGRSSRALNDALDDLGVRRGGSPGRDTSTFAASMLTDAFEDALALHADQVLRPNLDDDEFASARTVALEEIASLDDDPAGRMFEELIGRSFATGRGNSPYGDEHALEALAADALREDARRRVGPSGSILAVAGGLAWERVSAAAEEAFGDWTGQTAELPSADFVSGARKHLDATSAQTQIGFSWETVAPAHEDWYAHSVAMQVLSGTMGARLFSEVREKRGLVYSVSAFTRAIRGFAFALGYAGTTPERAEETLDVTLREVGRLYADGIEADELERARTGLLTDLIMQGESSRGRASGLARDLWIRGEPRELAAIHEAVARVSLDDVNDALARRPRPEPTVVTLGPAQVAEVTG